jgi:hypothetical protein
VAPVTAGPDAWQEWRPVGPGRVWVCTVGRRATHGTFVEFVAALGAPHFGPDRVGYEAYGLGWTGPSTVDGRVADLDPDGPQVANPAGTLYHGDEVMTIDVDGATYQIDLRRGRPLDVARE